MVLQDVLRIISAQIYTSRYVWLKLDAQVPKTCQFFVARCPLPFGAHINQVSCWDRTRTAAKLHGWLAICSNILVCFLYEQIWQENTLLIFYKEYIVH